MIFVTTSAYAETEDVRLAGVVFVVQHLGRHVAGRPTAREQQAEVSLEGREAEVNQDWFVETALAREDDILGLEVAVDYRLALQVRERLEHFEGHGLHVRLGDRLLLVVDHRAEAVPRVQLAQAVDVVVPFVDLEDLQQARVRDLAHHHQLVQQTLLSEPRLLSRTRPGGSAACRRS